MVKIMDNNKKTNICMAAWIVFFAAEFLLIDCIVDVYHFLFSATLTIQGISQIGMHFVCLDADDSDKKWALKAYYLITGIAMCTIVSIDILSNLWFFATAEFELLHMEVFRLCMLVTCWALSIPLSCIYKYRVWIPYGIGILLYIFMLNKVHHHLHEINLLSGHDSCMALMSFIAAFSVIYGYGVLFIIVRRLEKQG